MVVTPLTQTFERKVGSPSTEDHYPFDGGRQFSAVGRSLPDIDGAGDGRKLQNQEMFPDVGRVGYLGHGDRLPIGIQSLFGDDDAVDQNSAVLPVTDAVKWSKGDAEIQDRSREGREDESGLVTHDPGEAGSVTPVSWGTESGRCQVQG